MSIKLTVLLISIASVSCTTTSSLPLNEPFRVGVIKMDPSLDRIKPIAEADFAGWREASGVLVGSVDNTWVTGIEVESKKTLWWVDGDGAGLASPITVHGEWAILGFRDGVFKKINIRTGAKSWDIHLDSFSARNAVLVNDLLLVMTTSQQLYAIDFEDGSTKWLYDGGFPEGLHMFGAAEPVSDGTTVFVGMANGSLHAIDLASGRPQWQHEGQFSSQRFRDVMGGIVIRNNSVTYARYDGQVQSVDFNGVSRQTNWEKSLSAVTATSFHNGRFYVGCLNGDLYALDVESGEKLWTAPTGQAITSITPGESTIYLGGADGRINAVNALNGDIRWHDDLNGQLSTAPVVMAGNLYFATGYKNLYGYKIK